MWNIGSWVRVPSSQFPLKLRIKFLVYRVSNIVVGRAAYGRLVETKSRFGIFVNKKEIGLFFKDRGVYTKSYFYY